MPFGYVVSIFDGLFGVLSWAVEGEFVQLSDVLGTLGGIYVNLAQPQRELVNSVFEEVNDWNSRSLVYLNSVDYDPDGLWLMFQADTSKSESLWNELNTLVTSYFPEIGVNNQLNLVVSSESRIPQLPNSYLSNPVFDPDFYLLTYSDLRNVFGRNNSDEARQHWTQYGLSEARRSSPAFDVRYYRDIHSDLTNVFGNDYYGVVDHWLRHGIPEGRRSSVVFDVKYYLGKYPDLQQAFGSTNYAAAVDHWLRHGVSEGRQGSSDFDPRFYLSSNPDVANVYGADNYMGAIAHYLEFGRSEGRRGAP